MRAIIYRTYNTVNTTGVWLFFDDNEKEIFKCFSLELPDKQNQKKISCIPEDVYTVKSRPPSKKFNYKHFEIMNVPDRDAILIHVANYVDTRKVELLGCIAPCMKLIDMNGDKIPDGSESGKALEKIVSIMPEEWELTIEKAKI